MLNNNNLKITVISHSYPDDNFPAWGIFVKDQATWLNDIAEVHVIAPRPRTLFPFYFKRKWYYYSQISYVSYSDDIRILRPQYLTLPGSLLKKRRGDHFAKVVLSEVIEKPDIFHVHFAYPDGCVVKKLKQKYPEVPVVLSVHGSDWYASWNDPEIKDRVIENLRISDKILTVGERLRTDISSIYPELKHKIQVVPNGVEFKKRIESEPSGHRSATNKINILVVANYVECKGIDVLLKAISSLDDIDFEMIVIGRINSKKYYDQLSALKSKLGLDTKVTFKGEMPREDLQEYYSLCDFLVLPSKKEGFGIVLIEALAMGKPVVSTRSGGPEDIVNGLNGLLAEPGDIPSLAGSIEQMIVKYKEYDPGVISKDIYSRYSSDKIRNKLMMVYKELLGEK